MIIVSVTVRGDESGFANPSEKNKDNRIERIRYFSLSITFADYFFNNTQKKELTHIEAVLKTGFVTLLFSGLFYNVYKWLIHKSITTWE